MPPILFPLATVVRANRIPALGTPPLLVYPAALAPGQYLSVSGVTKDSTGATLGSVTVRLLQSADDRYIEQVVSDGLGNYEFRIAGPGENYWLEAYKVGSPDVAGTTVRTVVGSTPRPSFVSYSATVIADAPVGYWRLGEASGHLVDQINGVNTTTETALTYGVAGAPLNDTNTACSFSHASSSVAATNFSAFDNVGDVFSVELWFKRGAGGLGILLDLFNKGSGGGGNAPEVFIATDNKIGVTGANNGVSIATSSLAISDTTTWHHLVVTKTGGTTKIYVDNVDVTVAGTPDTLTNSTSGLTFGNTWDGTLDEIAYYGTALSAAQVAAHYHAAGY